MGRAEDARPSCIYGLTDPRHDDEVRYVGKCARPTAYGRRGQHIREAIRSAADTYKLNWLRCLLDQGLEPGVVILEAGTWDLQERNAAELKWILHYWSPRLTNNKRASVGGYPQAGHAARSSGPQTELGKKRVAESNRRRMQDPEFRARWAASRKATAERTRDEASERARAMWQRPEYRAAQAAAVNPRGTGRPCSPEKRAKIAATNRATKQALRPPITKVCAWSGCDVVFEVPYRRRSQVACSRAHGVRAANERQKMMYTTPAT